MAGALLLPGSLYGSRRRGGGGSRGWSRGGGGRGVTRPHRNTARQAMDGLWTEARGQQKQSNDPGNNQHIPQYANYWAPLTRRRHTIPHPAQPQHTNHWAPGTRKRHQQEHRPQRPTERSDPTQHAKGRAGDCPGPRKGATTRRTVTQGLGGSRGGGGGGNPLRLQCTAVLMHPWRWGPCPRQSVECLRSPARSGSHRRCPNVPWRRRRMGSGAPSETRCTSGPSGRGRVTRPQDRVCPS